MTCPVCETPYPVPGLARTHLLEHWADYILASMNRAMATGDWREDNGNWLDFGPWLRAQVKLTKELEVKYGK